jgi:hypothetical protein
MNKKTISHFRVAYIVIFFLFVFLYLIKIVQPELFYFAQQPPFQTNKYFFSAFLLYPGGLAEYVALFISQFFYFNWLGSLIITLTLFFLLILGYKIFRLIVKSGDLFFWMFLPVIILFSLFSNYLFSYVTVLNVLLTYLTVLLSFRLLNSSLKNWFYYFLIGPLIYYINGGGSFELFSASFIIYLLYKIDFKTAKIPVLIIALIATALPYLSYKFVFNIPLSHAYFVYYPFGNKLLLNYKNNFFFYAFYYSAPALILLMWVIVKMPIRDKSQVQKKTQKMKSIDKPKDLSNSIWYNTYNHAGTPILIIALTIIFTTLNANKHQNNIVKADFYCSNENWEKALKIIKSDPIYDVTLNLLYNRAIDNTGKYLDKYFDYPQLIGSSGTYPDKLNLDLLFMYYNDYYFDLGYISESQKWGYKVLSAYPYSPRVLERLVITNFILGEYKIAEKLLNTLNDNLLSDSFVKKYMPYIIDTSLISKDKLIATQRSLMPVNMITPINSDARYYDLLEKNKQNKRAYDHLQMNLLLDHDFGSFYRNLSMAPGFYGASLPKVFEQALLIIISTKKEIDKKYNISMTTYESFKSFRNIYRTFGSNADVSKSKLQDYKNTLYYYILYDSPKITKNQIVVSKEDEYSH